MSEIKRPRVILTDEEIAHYIASPRAKRAKLKLLSVAARTEGGMRTGEFVRWDSSMMDRVDFEGCVIPRAKKGQLQALEIPPVLGRSCARGGRRMARLRAVPCSRTHEGRGRLAPPAAPPSPTLRRELLRTGVVRHACDGSCVREKDPEACQTCPATRSTTAPRRRSGSSSNSFRRAFDTALAEAGVKVKQAMHLAGHWDPKVHAMYMMSTKRMQRIARRLCRRSSRSLRAPR